MPTKDEQEAPSGGSYSDVLKRLTSPGDIAAASIGFGSGLIIDYALMHVGIPPGTAATGGAVTLLGLKNGAQVGWKRYAARRRLRKFAHGLKTLLESYVAEAEATAAPSAPGPTALPTPVVRSASVDEARALLHKFELEYRMWQNNATDDETFETILNGIAHEYRYECMPLRRGVAAA